METGTLVSVEEYLCTAYEPDREYVDGVLVERNVGKRKHSRLQTRIITHLASFEAGEGVVVLTEQRVRIGPTRFRIPDVCALRASDPNDQVVQRPPLLCVEILSPDDSMSQTQEKVEEYLASGVPMVWILDPWRRKAYMADAAGVREAKDGRVAVPGTGIAVECAALWE